MVTFVFNFVFYLVSKCFSFGSNILIEKADRRPSMDNFASTGNHGDECKKRSAGRSTGDSDQSHVSACKSVSHRKWHGRLDETIHDAVAVMMIPVTCSWDR